MPFDHRTLSGSLTGTPIENEDNLAFSVQQGIRSMNEVVPLTDAPGFGVEVNTEIAQRYLAPGESLF